MKTKHAPGKWEIKVQDDNTILIRSKLKETICKITHPFGDDTAKANAQLIADAPEMVKHLREVFDALLELRQDMKNEKADKIIDIETGILQLLYKHGYAGRNANAK